MIVGEVRSPGPGTMERVEVCPASRSAGRDEPSATSESWPSPPVDDVAARLAVEGSRRRTPPEQVVVAAAAVRPVSFAVVGEDRVLPVCGRRRNVRHRRAGRYPAPAWITSVCRCRREPCRLPPLVGVPAAWTVRKPSCPALSITTETLFPWPEIVSWVEPSRIESTIRPLVGPRSRRRPRRQSMTSAPSLAIQVVIAGRWPLMLSFAGPRRGRCRRPPPPVMMSFCRRSCRKSSRRDVPGSEALFWQAELVWRLVVADEEAGKVPGRRANDAVVAEHHVPPPVAAVHVVSAPVGRSRPRTSRRSCRRRPCRRDIESEALVCLPWSRRWRPPGHHVVCRHCRTSGRLPSPPRQWNRGSLPPGHHVPPPPSAETIESLPSLPFIVSAPVPSDAPGASGDDRTRQPCRCRPSRMSSPASPAMASLPEPPITRIVSPRPARGANHRPFPAEHGVVTPPARGPVVRSRRRRSRLSFAVGWPIPGQGDRRAGDRARRRRGSRRSPAPPSEVVVPLPADDRGRRRPCPKRGDRCRPFPLDRVVAARGGPAPA